MSAISTRRISLRSLPTFFLLLGLCACGTSPPLVNEFLDSGTGVTVTSNNTPLVLYRENPAHAAYSRNFVHIGPIEVNRTGKYQYFLWIGVWNTMQLTNDAKQRDGFESIVLYADGEPLALELAGWTPEAIGTSQSVYLKPVASAADAYYNVTVDQIRLIAEAKDIRLRTTGASPREYQLWDNQRDAHQSLQAFLESAFF